MSLSPLRRTASAAVLTLALVGLSACSGDDSAESSATDTSSETEAAATEDGEDPETEAAEPTDGEEISAEEMTEVFKEAFEDASTATISMQLGGAMEYDANGVIDFTTTPVSMKLAIELSQAPKPLEMIIVDGFVYQNLMGDQFVKTSIDDPSSGMGDLGAQLDIRQQFDLFEDAITAATYVGEEDGLDRYSIVLDSAVLMEEQGADLEGMPAGAVPDTFTYDLWFDDEGNFRRMEGSLGELGGDLVATYDNWGEPVDISAPPASQITEMPGMAG